MGFVRFVKLIAAIELVLHGASWSVDALSMDYYSRSCPFAEMIVKDVVRSMLSRDPTLSAGLLRMHFHDCFVQGCDGSVLIDSTGGNRAEKDSLANLSLRGFEVIDAIKDEIEKRCSGIVSCADIVAMAARDAVFFTGGPYYDILKGRKDGRRSRLGDTFVLPGPSSNSTDLIDAFSRRGFTVRDLVALSGAHTLGAARCRQFKDRLMKFDSSHNVDPSLDPYRARSLSRACTFGGDDAEAAFDRTRVSFDNDYYILLQNNAGVLTSDQTLYSSPETHGLVDVYAANQAMFFFDFTRAMVKIGLLDVKEGYDGEVRMNCRRINY